MIGPTRRAALLFALIAAATVASCTSSPTPSPTEQPPAPTQTAQASTPPVAFAGVTVAGVGAIRQGGSSGDNLVLSFLEAGRAGFGRGHGSFELTITDHAGAGSTVHFTGSPSTAKSPGSLGATATISANVLTVRILDSDPFNIEPIIVTGIGIAAAPAAAIGSIGASIGVFTGSFAGGATSDAVASPGAVVANP